MAKKPREEEPTGNWMDTYGDMVTLLLTFFVMLFSMSSVNEEKFALLVQAFTSKDPNSINIILDQTHDEESDYPINRGESPATADTLANASIEDMRNKLPENFDELYAYLKTYVAKSGMEGSVEVSREGDGVIYIRFQDNIFFNPDSSVLKNDSAPLLDFFGECLKNVEDQILTININGHTADPGIQNYRVSDWRLSSERASNVAIYFEEQKGIDPHKLLPIGYGKNFPVAPNDTPEGRQKNRRVDMIIVSQDSGVSDQQLLQSILNGAFDPSEYPDSGGVADILIPQEGESEPEEDTTVSSSSQPSPVTDQDLPLPEDIVVRSPYGDESGTE